MALKRILSLLIALLMVLSVSVTSFANNETTETVVKYNIKAYDKALSLVKSILNESVFGEVPENVFAQRRSEVKKSDCFSREQAGDRCNDTGPPYRKEYAECVYHPVKDSQAVHERYSRSDWR